MRPLAGARIAVTRPADQADDLAEPLRAAGAEVVTAPLIRVEPTMDRVGIRRAITRMREYAWVIFTSANGVGQFMAAFREAGAEPELLKDCRVACVGPATAAVARKAGLAVDLIPTEFVGEAIADAIAQRGEIRGTRVLVARAAGARETLIDRLKEEGADVEELELYRSVPDLAGIAILKAKLAAGAVDVVTFTSASTARYFAQFVGASGSAICAAIGPITAAEARRHGLTVSIEAKPHTTSGLVQKIIEHWVANHAIGGHGGTG